MKSVQTSDAPSTNQYQQARTTLGETFGTKKAKAAIRAQERNKVDVSAMEGVMDYVIQGIEKGAEGLMTTGLLLFLGFPFSRRNPRLPFCDHGYNF